MAEDVRSYFDRAGVTALVGESAYYHSADRAILALLDEELLEAANILAGEKVQIVNVNNGERIETYAIRGERGRGQVCLNGAAARKAAVGDVVIIISYASMDFEEAKTFKPSGIFPDTATNKLI